MTARTAAALTLLGAGLAAPPAHAQTLVSQQVVGNMTGVLWCGHAPGDQARLFILEQRRGVRIADLQPNGTATLRPAPFLDLTTPALVNLLGANGLEYGVLGMAFHPDYASNGCFYLACTPTGAGSVNDYAIVRFQVDPANPNLADPASKHTVTRIVYPRVNHRAGWLEFGPDGYLYFTTGDGGEQDPDNVASNKSIPRGKLLRIDVDGPDDVPGNADDDAFPPATDEKNYAIPPANPFLHEPASAPEIFAYGFRNPWRASFDPANGDLWIGDVGQVAREEIDYIPAGTSGQFFGWRCMEGTVPTNYAGCTSPLPPSTLPIFDYPRSGGPIANGISVTGGVVYRGCAMPAMHGRYFFGDWSAAACWSAERSGGTLTGFINHAPSMGLTGGITHFGVDTLGEMYFVRWSLSAGQSSVWRIRPGTLQGPDCNANQQPDACDVAAGSSPDLNADGVPDECQGFPCSQDFNHDGDFGTDQDIEAFFACLAGACCPACSSQDYNGDGDFGTDQDVEAFFRVLAGQPC